MPMHEILHLRSSQGLYGADHVVLALAQATASPFRPVIVPLVRAGRGDALGDAARERNLEVAQLSSRGRTDLATARALSAILRARGTSLIHAHDYKSLSVAALAGMLSRTPVVATFHGDTRTSVKVRAYEAFARLLANSVAGVAAVSQSLAGVLRTWAPLGRVVHVPNGIVAGGESSEAERAEARASFGIDGSEKVIAVVGRLSPEKGHGVLIDALRLSPLAPVVLVAGDGALRTQWEEASHVRAKLLGFRRDVRSVYAACDVLVIPSLREGLPLVALEAMAAGRPVLASAVGELPEVLGGGAGRVVPPGDAAALAAALAELFADEEARLAMGRAASRRVMERYSAGAMARTYAELLYEPALSRSRRSPHG